jgi:hypothetical protein
LIRTHKYFFDWLVKRLLHKGNKFRPIKIALVATTAFLFELGI